MRTPIRRTPSYCCARAARGHAAAAPPISEMNSRRLMGHTFRQKPTIRRRVVHHSNTDWLMSEEGQSLQMQRAPKSIDVRFAPKATVSCRNSVRRYGPCVDGSELARLFSRVQQHLSVQPCVRPMSAVHMTAGHNALRGSGPGQKRAFDNALAHVGCPDRRIDRLCITCCSPSQPSHHAGRPV